VLSAVLASIHNVRFYQRLMEQARHAIEQNTYESWRSGFLDEYAQGR
jgi:queuine tRNA-ribosyltransferase